VVIEADAALPQLAHLPGNVLNEETEPVAAAGRDYR
jgi:hypothetical protein